MVIEVARVAGTMLYSASCTECGRQSKPGTRDAADRWPHARCAPPRRPTQPIPAGLPSWSSPPPARTLESRVRELSNGELMAIRYLALGMSMREVAADAGVPASQLHSYASAARRKLRLRRGDDLSALGPEIERILDLPPLKLLAEPKPAADLAVVVPAEFTTSDWRNHAVCLGDPEPFFYADGEAADARERRDARARAVCLGGCPVRRECLETGLKRSDGYGFWGGFSEAERRNMRARGDIAV